MLHHFGSVRLFAALAGSPRRSTPRRRASVAILAALALIVACLPSAHAQSVTLAGSQTALGSGFNQPYGVAVDAAGDIFLTDTYNSLVKEIIAVNGTIPTNPTILTLGTGFNHPYGIAVDALGDLFIADTVNGAVKEIVAVNGVIPAIPTINTLTSGLSNPFGVAVDSKGDVYVAVAGSSTVSEIVAVNGVVPVNNPTVVTLGSGFNVPYGVAVDASGDVFVADSANNAVKEIVAVSGTIPANPTIQLLGSGFNQPQAVAVDASGDVIVTDASGNLYKLLAVGGSVSTHSALVSLGIFNGPEGVAVNPSGGVVFADPGQNQIVALQAQTASFGGINVCPAGQTTPAPCNNTLTLTYNVAAGTTVGSVKILTTGALNLDFQAESSDTSTTLCSAQSYNLATTCTVDVTFAPLAPGERNGAVQVLDGGGNVLATTNISGIGTGAAIAFSPSATANIGSGFKNPAATALDASGDLFIADSANNAVKEVLAINGRIPASPTIRVLATGFSDPSGIAVDAAGDVFVADSGNGAVKEILAVAGTVPSSNPTVVTLAAGSFTKPVSLTLDGSGNIFVADSGNSTVDEILAASAYTTVKTLGSGFSTPNAVALDSAGDVFVADTGNSAIKEIPAAGGYHTVKTLASGFSAPNGIAVDAAGDVFVADTGNDEVKQILAAGAYTTIMPLYTGTVGASPNSVALDATGNVYIGIQALASVLELQRSVPASFTFAPTVIGAISSDSPKPVQFQNIGNASLIGNGGLTDYTDFVVVPGPGIVPDCNASAQTLVPGAECNLSYEFTPQSAGPLSSLAALSDNVLNVAAAVQTYTLSGIGLANVPAIAFTVPNHTYGDAPFTLSATSNSSAPIAYAYVSGPASVVGSTLTITGAGTVTVKASQSASGNFAAGSQLASFQVAAATPIVTWSAPAPIAFGTPLSATQLNAKATFAAASVAGTYLYTPALGTVLSPGTQTLSVSFSPTDSTDFTSAIATVKITVNSIGTPVNLSGAYNVDAITSLGSVPQNGGFSASYSYQSNMIGTSLTYQNLAFPLGAANTLDAVSNEKIALPGGSYNQLYLLGASAYGPYTNQTIVVTYTDGTSSTFTQSFSDWGNPQSYTGESTVLQMSTRITPFGIPQFGPWYVYGYTFNLTPGKIAASVTLPANRNIVFLSAGLGARTAVNLSSNYNVYGIAGTGVHPQGGGLDTESYAYQSSLIGTSLSYQNVAFPLTANALDAVSNAKIALPAGPYNQLYLLGAGVNGAQTNQSIVVTYTDGTSSTFTQSFSDWGYPQNYTGETTVLQMATRITPTGATQAGPWNVYGYTFNLTAGKTAASVTLAANRDVVFLGVSLGGATVVNLAGAYNVDAIATAGSIPQNGGFSSSYAYQSNLIGTSLNYQNVAFPLGAANTQDAASNEKIALPAGIYDQLYLVGASAYGPYTNQTVIVTYTDGTTSTFTQSFSDWGNPQNYTGESTVLQMATRVTPFGTTQTGPWYAYGYTFNLTPGKIAASVTLPANRNIVFLAVGLGDQ